MSGNTVRDVPDGLRALIGSISDPRSRGGHLHFKMPMHAHPAQLMIISAAGGASLLLAADIAVRCIPTSAELKLGVVTALLGAPVFLYLIFKLRRLESS